LNIEEPSSKTFFKNFIENKYCERKVKRILLKNFKRF